MMKKTFPFTLIVFALLQPFALAAEWELVWADEFETEGHPDPTKWGYEKGYIRNKEPQYYTVERLENVRVEDSVLVIEGIQEAYPIPDSEDPATGEPKMAEYTSGSINTLGKQDFQYGRIEVRAKVPQGKGMWPAIWMMGTNRTKVGWPRCGEIDIMEYVGKDPNTIHATCHFADLEVTDKAKHRGKSAGKLHAEAPYDDFHVYAIEWDAEQIRFFMDDTEYGKFDIDLAGEGADNPFRKPHYLLLNFAIGGTWGGPIDHSMLPQRYEIDYVRAYQKADETVSASE